MSISNDRPVHAKTITDFDRAHFQNYLFVLDATKDGHGWQAVANALWPGGVPENAEDLVGEFLKRARWMTHTGFKLLLAESPLSPAQELEGLVADGQMSPEERNYLKSDAGQHFWLQKRH